MAVEILEGGQLNRCWKPSSLRFRRSFLGRSRRGRSAEQSEGDEDGAPSSRPTMAGPAHSSSTWSSRP